MIEAVRAKGHEPADDNEADAIALAYLAKAMNESSMEVGK